MSASTCSAPSDAVARRGVVEEDEVAGLLAAEVVAARAHRLDDVAIADLRAHELAAHLRHRALEPEVAHHRGDDGALR